MWCELVIKAIGWIDDFKNMMFVPMLGLKLYECSLIECVWMLDTWLIEFSSNWMSGSRIWMLGMRGIGIFSRKT